MKLRKRSAAALLALPLALGACSGGQQQGDGNQGGASSQAQQQNDPFSAQPGQDVDKDAFLKQMQDAMQAKKTYEMTMQMAAQGQTVKMSGQGDIADPNAPKMNMKMEMPGQAGAQGALNIIMDGQAMYMQLPGQAGGKYVKMSMQELSQAGGQDFQKLMNPSENLKMSQEAIQKVTFKGQEDVSGEKLKHYSVTLDPQKAQEAMNGGQPAPAPSASGQQQRIPYDIWVDDQKVMRKVTMEIQGTKLDMTVDKYGEPVQITAPPTSQQTTMPAPGGQGGQGGQGGSGGAGGATQSPAPSNG